LKYFEAELAGKVNNVFTLKGGMGKKQRRSTAEAIAAVPECEPRVILATGSYIGEGFDECFGQTCDPSWSEWKGKWKLKPDPASGKSRAQTSGSAVERVSHPHVPNPADRVVETGSDSF
jgi:hypothetical protein